MLASVRANIDLIIKKKLPFGRNGGQANEKAMEMYSLENGVENIIDRAGRKKNTFSY